MQPDCREGPGKLKKLLTGGLHLSKCLPDCRKELLGITEDRFYSFPGCVGRLEHLGDKCPGFVAKHQTQPDQGSIADFARWPLRSERS
jgi:hypothetical protein